MKKNILLPILSVFIFSFCFAGFAAINKQIVFGYNYNYNYGYDDIGGGYSCGDGNHPCNNNQNSEDNGHRGGMIWRKYKHYSERYAKNKSRKIYYKIAYLEKSKNPALKVAYQEMRNIYELHKFDSKKVFSKLSLSIQEKFRLYKEYHGHKKYREYKKEVY